MRFSRIFPLILLIIGVSSVHGQGTLPVFEKDDCPFGEIDEAISCGWLIVPESRQDANSSTIELAVAIIESTNPNAPDDPIIYLEGGPGGGALAAADFWLTSSLRATRNLILIDQRGTGFSEPSLNCSELNEEIDNPTQDCHDRLVSEGVNLAAYTSVENAADIADLLVVLDIQQANLYGVSYGTRLALTVMRDHPERIRTVIIDAVYPPHVQGLDEQALYGQRAFEVLFNDCAADAECNAAYPNLRQTFYDTIDQLNESPALIEDIESGEETELYGDDVVNQIYGLLYDTEALPYLPALIAAYGDGDYEYDPFADASAGEEENSSDAVASEDMSDEEFDAFMMEYLEYDNVDDLYEYLDTLSDDDYEALIDEALSEAIGGEGFADEIDSDSEGMYNSVECYEEVHFNSVEAAEALSVDVPEQLKGALVDSIAGQFDDCAIWNVPQSSAFENEPVVSDIPTLVLSGNYDPITPPAWGQAAADFLPNSHHFVFPNIGHGAVDSQDCPTAIALQFLDNPAGTPDGSCVSTMTPPDFVIR